MGVTGDLGAEGDGDGEVVREQAAGTRVRIVRVR